MNMKKVSVQTVPCLITTFQQEDQVNCSCKILAICDENQRTFLANELHWKKIWVHHLNEQESKTQYTLCTLINPNQKGTYLSFFWQYDACSLVGPKQHSMDSLAKGSTINKTYASSLLKLCYEHPQATLCTAKVFRSYMTNNLHVT